MANTLIKLRRGAGNWWDITNKPSGATGYNNGIVDYGTTNEFNYQVDNTSTPTTRTFNQLAITKGEPWVNTTTKQLWIDNVVINPAIKLLYNGEPITSSMTFNASTYEAQQVFELSNSDQYLKNVASLEMPTTSAGATNIQDFMADVIGGQASDYTASLNTSTNVWTVTWGTPQNTHSKTFDAGHDYLGFGWHTDTDVLTPTFLKIPDTDTKSMNVVSGYASGDYSTSDSSTDLTEGNVHLNSVETVGGVSLVSNSHLIVGDVDEDSDDDGIDVTYDASEKTISIAHVNSITPGVTTFELNGNKLTGTKITYGARGHILDVEDFEINLPSGGSGSANTFTVSADTEDSVSPTQGFAQAVITEEHRVDTDIQTITGTAGQTTVNDSGNNGIGNVDTLTYNNVTYSVSSVSGSTITLGSALEDDIPENAHVTWNHPERTKMFKLQQSGLTASTLSSYSGTKVTFAKASNNSDTASNNDKDSTILMNVDVIDGGTFN